MSVYAQEYGYFFNSQNSDRKYNADSFETWLRPFFISGVFQGSLQVKAQASPDMTVQVTPGYANLQGKPAHWPDTNNLTLATASGVYNRIDTIVLRRDNTNRAISIEVVTGVASANPQPTAPTRTADIFELVLAQILVGVGVTAITAANISDTRMNSDICGYVAATVEEIDFDQIKAQFDAWLAEFKEGTAEDYAAFVAQLREDLEAYQSAIDAHETTASGDLERFETTIREYIAELEAIIDAGTVAPLQLQVDQLEEDFYESPWRRPEGLLTDQSGNTIEDQDGNPINITTLSQAEIAAGVINGNLHY